MKGQTDGACCKMNGPMAQGERLKADTSKKKNKGTGRIDKKATTHRLRHESYKHNPPVTELTQLRSPKVYYRSMAGTACLPYCHSI